MISLKKTEELMKLKLKFKKNKKEENKVEDTNPSTDNNSLPNEEIVEEDSLWNNDFNGSLYVSSLYLDGNVRNKSGIFLKIIQPLQTVLKGNKDEKVTDNYLIRTLPEMNELNATTFLRITNVLKLVFDNNDDEVWQDIEDIYKVLINSDSDISNSVANKHYTFFNDKPDLSSRNFSNLFIRLPSGNKQLVSMMVLPTLELDNQIDNVFKGMLDSTGNERREMAKKEVEDRKQQCASWIDLPCFEDFKLLFSNEKECKEVALKIYKVANYLLYWSLRKNEVINEDLNQLGSTSDSILHYKELKTKILINSAYAKKNGIDTHDRLYSSDIVYYENWNLKVIEFLVKLLFGDNIIFTSKKENVLTLNEALNNQSQLEENIRNRLKRNLNLQNSTEFANIGQEKYISQIIKLIQEYSFTHNNYYDLYVFYKNNYHDNELYINGTAYNFNELEYFIWLWANLLNASRQRYFITQLVYKYCASNTLDSLNDILDKYTQVLPVIKDTNGEYVEQNDNWMSRYLDYIDFMYLQNSTHALRSYDLSMQEFIKKYNENEEEF